MALYIIMVAVIVQALLSWINPYSPMAPVLDSFTARFCAGSARASRQLVTSICLPCLF